MKSFTPQTLNELYASLAELTPESKIIGGGTDLIMHLNAGRVKPDALLYMGHIKELKAIEEVNGFMEIGAAATMTEIEKCPLLQGRFGALIDSAKDVGSLQIRNNGTIGGNIGNASPAGDLIPVLFMLDAILVIATPEGSAKELPIQEVILGPGKKNLTHQEAIVKIKLPMTQPTTYKSAFVKLGSRAKVTISRIGVTMGLDLVDGTIVSAQMVVGAISLTPVAVKKAEEIMIGRKIDAALKQEVGQILSDLIMEITPEKFDRDYKVWAAKGVVEDVLNKF